MQTLEDLNIHFAIPDALVFEQMGELIIARITSNVCSGTLFLQGAHLVHWQPEGTEPVLFLSERSAFEPGKAIRGGVPVIFPWFGPRTGKRTDGPSHGFARTELWEVAFAAMFGDDLYLTLTLSPNETSRNLGFDHFRVVYEIVFGRTLTMRMGVANQGDTPLQVEQALHTYFHVGEAEQLRIHGLGDTQYIDKTDNFARKWQEEEELTLHGETDRPYLNTKTAVTIEDPVMRRQIKVDKQGSKTTVVWNPWSALAAKLPDMADDAWHSMVCVETANAADNALTLQPREVHTMEAKISVSPLTPDAAL